MRAPVASASWAAPFRWSKCPWVRRMCVSVRPSVCSSAARRSGSAPGSMAHAMPALVVDQEAVGLQRPDGNAVDVHRRHVTSRSGVVRRAIVAEGLCPPDRGSRRARRATRLPERARDAKRSSLGGRWRRASQAWCKLRQGSGGRGPEGRSGVFTRRCTTRPWTSPTNQTREEVTIPSSPLCLFLTAPPYARSCRARRKLTGGDVWTRPQGRLDSAAQGSRPRGRLLAQRSQRTARRRPS